MRDTSREGLDGMLRVSLQRLNLPSSVAKRMLGSDMVLGIPHRFRQLVGTELRGGGGGGGGGHDIGNGSASVLRGPFPPGLAPNSTSSALYLSPRQSAVYSA